MDKGEVDVIFCSSVLEYLEHPYSVLQEFAASGVQYILLDRTPFIDAEKDRLTVQNISFWGGIKIPSWFFSESFFLRAVNKTGYVLCSDFLSDDVVNIDSDFKGMLFKRTEDQ